jgi:hypothetical protein
MALIPILMILAAKGNFDGTYFSTHSLASSPEEIDDLLTADEEWHR